MDIIELLKQFKKIEPGKEYAKQSRHSILSLKQKERQTFWQIFARSAKVGTALAFSGLLIFMILGGFSAWKMLSPLQISNLDPASLKAEAQAIDMQIQLANLNYENNAAGKTDESTQASPLPASSSPKPSESPSPAEKAQNAPSSTPISVDEALQKLSE